MRMPLKIVVFPNDCEVGYGCNICYEGEPVGSFHDSANGNDIAVCRDCVNALARILGSPGLHRDITQIEVKWPLKV